MDDKQHGYPKKIIFLIYYSDMHLIDDQTPGVAED